MKHNQPTKGLDMKTSKQIAQEMVDALFRGAASIVAKGEEHMPLFAVEMDDGRREMLPAPVECSKHQIAQAHRALAGVHGVAAVALIMEAWVAESKAGKDDPAVLPEKGEAILFNIRVGADDQFIAKCDIDRKSGTLERGKLIDIAHPEEGERFEGRMVGDGRNEQRRRMN